MPRRTAEDAEQTRLAIMDAARTQFATVGFDAVTLDGVAAAAGVTRGAVYHHFGGKAGLFRAVLEQILSEQGEHILAAAERESGAFEGLEAGCHRFIELAQRPEYVQIALIDAPAVLGITAWQALDDAATTSHLREGLRELFEGRSQTDVEALAQSLSGAMNQIALWAATAGPQKEAKALARAKASLSVLLAGLRGAG
jgi:AcrR family transcriptional regulator